MTETRTLAELAGEVAEELTDEERELIAARHWQQQTAMAARAEQARERMEAAGHG